MPRAKNRELSRFSLLYSTACGCQSARSWGSRSTSPPSMPGRGKQPALPASIEEADAKRRLRISSACERTLLLGGFSYLDDVVQASCADTFVFSAAFSACVDGNFDFELLGAPTDDTAFCNAYTAFERAESSLPGCLGGFFAGACWLVCLIMPMVRLAGCLQG